MCLAEQNPRHLMRDIEARILTEAQTMNESRDDAPAVPGLLARLREVFAGWMRKEVKA
jgi:hypothetical protein